MDTPLKPVGHPGEESSWATTAKVSAAVLATAAVGGAATTPQADWYERIPKPPIQPPPWAFGAVWTPLYANIAVTSSQVLNRLRRSDPTAAQQYAIALGTNLALNAGWSVLFWRSRRLGWATAEAVVLAASSADLVRRTAAVERSWGIRLAPYAAWTGYAAVLCGWVWRNQVQSEAGSGTAGP
ncbi:MAG: TspO/MBR family protein [Candidatus Nanopelagicales bacterium]